MQKHDNAPSGKASSPQCQGITVVPRHHIVATLLVSESPGSISSNLSKIVQKKYYSHQSLSRRIEQTRKPHCSNVSTTPITAMGYRQCLPLSVVQLKGKHCRKPHCCNGVVDTFGNGAILKCKWQQVYEKS